MRLTFFHCALFLASLSAPDSLRGQSFGSDFGGYAIFPLLQHDLGDTVPLSYGGLVMNPGNTNYLYITGNTAGSGAGIYFSYMLRDSSRHITGFLQRGTLLASAPKAGSGLTFLPNGALLHSIESGSGGVDIGVIVPGHNISTRASDLVPETMGGVQVVPPGFGGAGQLKILSTNGNNGKMYTTTYGDDFLNESFSPASLVTTLPNPGQGFVYVKGGSSGFPVDSMLVAEFKTGTVAAYAVDGSGNPLRETRRTFLAGLAAVVGLAVDPETRDLLASTRNNSSSVLVRISGFQAPPAPAEGYGVRANSAGTAARAHPRLAARRR